MVDDNNGPDHWWGDYTLESGQTAFWQVGPLRFWLARSDREWRFTSERVGDALDETLRCELPATGTEPSGESSTGPSSEPSTAMPDAGQDEQRFVCRQPASRLRLTPLLADRPMVVSPQTRLLLPPREEATLYLSTIAWLRVEIGEPPVEFLQLPLYRPSDTWFGPSTMAGELCYALKTRARLQAENLPVRPHRALSAVRVRNRAQDSLIVDSIKLPLPHMSLFAGQNGRLWTEQVTLERRETGEFAALELDPRPPAHISEPKKLSGPRKPPARGVLIRAFGGLMGGSR